MLLPIISLVETPAAVVPLNFWLSDDTMQLIAEENNLSETAFFVKQKKPMI